MKKTMATVAIVLASGSAFASFDAQYDSRTGRGSAFEITFNHPTDGPTTVIYGAGHMNFHYTDVGGDRGIGQFSGGSFSTFCIELQNTTGGAPRSYDIDYIRNAPDPAPGNGGPGYDYSDEVEVHAILAAAIDAQWINSDLSAGALATDTRLAAIQGLIWEAVLDEATVVSLHANVTAAMNDLVIDPNARVAGLRAMVNSGVQDQLYIVPLPTAAFAGMLTLAGLGGYKRLNRK
ncbi:MAG: hypothetical protein ACF8MF_00450 [Phycisphaerales bacterium JB052]